MVLCCEQSFHIVVGLGWYGSKWRVLLPNPLRSHRHELRPQGVILVVVVVVVVVDDVKGHPIETQ